MTQNRNSKAKNLLVRFLRYSKEDVSQDLLAAGVL